MNFSTTGDNGLHLADIVTTGTPNPPNCKFKVDHDHVECYAIQPFHPGSIFTFHVPLTVDANANQEHSGATLFANACSFKMTGGPVIYAYQDLTYGPPKPDLTIDKSVWIGAKVQGRWNLVYKVTVTNIGPDSSAGTFVVNDRIPAGLSLQQGGDFYMAPDGTFRSKRCSVSLDGEIECRSDHVLPPFYPEVFYFSFNTALDDGNTVTNTATVSGGGDVNAANNSSSVAFLLGTAVLSATKNHGRGKDGALQFLFTIRNTGNKPTNGRIYITDDLPSGLALGDISGLVGADCSLVVSRLTCNFDDVLEPNGKAKTIPIPIANVGGSLVNTINVSGGQAIPTTASDAVEVRAGAVVIPAPPKTTTGRK